MHKSTEKMFERNTGLLKGWLWMEKTSFSAFCCGLTQVCHYLPFLPLSITNDKSFSLSVLSSFVKKISLCCFSICDQAYVCHGIIGQINQKTFIPYACLLLLFTYSSL